MLDPIVRSVAFSWYRRPLGWINFSGTEVDYSTIRRKKPHGAVVTAPVSTKQVSPLVIDITKNSSTGRTPVDNTPTEEGIATAKTKDILQTPGEDHDAGDEGGGDSSEDGLTLSITDSDDDEDEMEADANAGKPHNVTQHKVGQHRAYLERTYIGK